MECLIIGGTGTISEGIAVESIKRGYTTTVINRGNNNDRIPKGANLLKGDINNAYLIHSFLDNKVYDVIVDPIAYNVEQLQQHIAIFQTHCKLYVFISSAAAIGNHDGIIDEKTKKTPKWDYGVDKLKCEEYLESINTDGFSYLIIRPSITYGDIRIPIPVACRRNPWTIIDRIMKNKPLVCFEYKGAHETFHNLMNIRDFSQYVVELFNKDVARNNDYLVCSDKAYSWEDAYSILYDALDKEKHVYEVDRGIFKFMNPTLYKDIVYDKDSDGAVFSNAKVKKDANVFVDECSLNTSIRLIVDYLQKRYSSITVEEQYNEMTDAILLCGVRNPDAFLKDYLNGLDLRYKLKLRSLWQKKRIKYAIKVILKKISLNYR